MGRVYNFSAGPAAIPLEVLEQAQREMLDWNGSGMSVMEMSHRGKDYMSIAEKAEADLRALMAIPANYKVLFLQGGASPQFSMIPMNLLAGKKSADYINTGAWSKKAISEAKKFCTPKIAATTEADKFMRAPAAAELKLDADAAYVHYTPNETIGGVEFPYVPATGERPAGRRHVLDDPLAADRRLEVRPDLRRRAEEHRPGGDGGGDHPRGPDRQGPRGHADDARLQDPRRRGVDVQHPADLHLVHRRPGLRVAAEERRPPGDGRDQRAQGEEALRGDRRVGFLQEPGRGRLALLDERALHAGEARAGRDRSSRRPRRRGWSPSRGTAPSAACAPASTTPCPRPAWTR